jgi:hypothetical protein
MIRAAGFAGSYTQLKAFVLSGAADAAGGAGDPVRNGGGPPSAGRLRTTLLFLGRVVRPARRAPLLTVLWCRFYVRQDMRTLVTRDLRLQGGALVRNLEFLRFAHHWSFTPRACRRYRAQTKGKVERPVRYLRDNFIYGRTFATDADLDQQRRQWLDDVANVLGTRHDARAADHPQDFQAEMEAGGRINPRRR